ncbi:MAG: ABC transporter related protein [candidate division TM6 bacterium GW2011_GWF2_32_72]|nr:MAG: ABC transporter related protein [candidate division TM6 bacterium GW2011_GWF2_32_72]
MIAVVIENLRKKYGEFWALRGINLNIPTGSIFGILGPNGAGKSTTIKALVGALEPTGGSVSILGLDPLKERQKLRKVIGYMPQSPALYEDLSARDNILFFGRAQCVQNLEKKVDEILEFTELVERQDDMVHTFSGGMKKRVSLACALIHNPDILILDEPTAAIDPHIKERTWELFRKISAKGITIIISTHLMDEALLCDRLAILRQGKVLAEDTPKKILEIGYTKVKITCDGTAVEKVIGGTPCELAALLREFGLAGVDSVDIEQESLDSIILKLIRDEE